MGKMAVLLVILVLALIVVTAYYLLNTGLIAKLANQPPATQNDVLVSGVISTSFSTSPSGINFTSQKTDQAFYSTIVKDGHYSITVPGNDTYNVTIYFHGLLGVSTSKNCRTTLSFNSTVTSFNFTRRC